MFSRIKNKVRRVIHKISDWFTDPPLDIIGIGVIGTYAGRTALYSAFGATFASVGMYTYAVTFFSVVLIDTLVHVEVLSALRRLMRFEVNQELLQLRASSWPTIR